MARSGTVNALRTALGLAYPFLVFGGLQVLEARWVALAIAVVFVARGLLGPVSFRAEQLRALVVPVLLVGAALAFSVLQNDAHALLLVPVAVNLALLVAFARSLVLGPPLVEVFARMQVPDLPDEEVRYCRSVTLLWCVFFLVNGAACAWFAFAASTWAWALYTGLISYLLIGLVFAAEFVVRSWRFGRYAGTPVEPLFRRLFRAPPEDRA